MAFDYVSEFIEIIKKFNVSAKRVFELLDNDVYPKEKFGNIHLDKIDGKIKIIKNGPYLVTGNIPLIELIITKINNGYVYKNGRTFDHNETYLLCRCGHSCSKPFCDGRHVDKKFDGQITASNKSVFSQSKKYIGKNLILEDAENLCAFARFCHGENTNVWSIIEGSNNPEEENLLVKLVCDCPSGRLVVYDKKTTLAIEPAFEESIVVLQDPERDCSGPFWIRRGILIEDENSNILEKRNRVTLCRCGLSSNKPYCDAYHVNSGFKDNK